MLLIITITMIIMISISQGGTKGVPRNGGRK